MELNVLDDLAKPSRLWTEKNWCTLHTKGVGLTCVNDGRRRQASEQNACEKLYLMVSHSPSEVKAWTASILCGKWALRMYSTIDWLVSSRLNVWHSCNRVSITTTSSTVFSWSYVQSEEKSRNILQTKENDCNMSAVFISELRNCNHISSKSTKFKLLRPNDAVKFVKCQRHSLRVRTVQSKHCNHIQGKKSNEASSKHQT